MTGVERLADVFLVEAYFKMYATEDTVRDCVAMWRRDIDAQQTSALTVAVTSSNLDWLKERIEGHPDVELLQTERTPGQAFSFEEAVMQA